VPGLARRVDGKVMVTPASPPRDQLDNLPVPDYEEYFEHAEELGILPEGNRNVWLPIETARGCWWGAKHHCTFCGLNGTSMSFRSKSPERVLDELSRQARRYRSCHFEAVDNILDPAYLRQLFPALVESGAGYQFFYEVKSNLDREQLKLLAQAGVTRVQPGLESLNSHVLGLMRKGVRAAQNVNLLRWARYYDINAEWNLLWGFPGETEVDYTEQAAIIPHLTHLQPPSSIGRIWLERFSPLFNGHGTQQITERTPERSYRYVYPHDVDLNKIAYFFDYQLEGGVPESAYAAVQSAVAAWSEAWLAEKPPLLTYWSAPHFVQIRDQRWPGHMGTYTFEDTLADLYLACMSRPTTAAAARRQLGLRLPAEAVQEFFIEFRDRGLMFLDGPFALALALPAIKLR
jgi:ribosomal peptide maturation radical SAM protein 1